MGHFSTETIFVIEKTRSEDIVSIVNEVMLENNLTISSRHNIFYFEDTDPDSDVDDSRKIEPETPEQAQQAWEEFKKHPTGGYYEYEMHWGYNEQGNELGYTVLVAFLSFDQKNIEAIIFDVNDRVFEMAHEKELKKVFAEINKRADIIMATQATDYYTEYYHGLDVIAEILSGNIETKFEYKFAEL
ncbi:hypothetical protein [Chryseobacterium sp. Mn2064]|uniref:hypothetical protein n=1 Tax=Chryseobacterium sp. Mn2064 TaxID=3395263 RepID=UPI003BE44B78